MSLEFVTALAVGECTSQWACSTISLTMSSRGLISQQRRKRMCRAERDSPRSPIIESLFGWAGGAATSRLDNSSLARRWLLESILLTHAGVCDQHCARSPINCK